MHNEFACLNLPYMGFDFNDFNTKSVFTTSTVQYVYSAPINRTEFITEKQVNIFTNFNYINLQYINSPVLCNQNRVYECSYTAKIIETSL